MGVLQRAANKFKSAFRRLVTHTVKYAAGCYFDFYLRQYRTGGLTFEIPRQLTTRAMRGRFAADTYELPERRLISRHLHPEGRVLELGGCIGVVSCVINRMLRDPRAHVVVEANHLLIPYLEGNRDLNGARFSVEQCVVSRKGDAALRVDPNMDSSRIDTGGGQKIPSTTLEQIEARHGLTFNTLVMDIEGSESQFIRENLSALKRMDLVMIEFHPTIVGDAEVTTLRSILTECGLERVDHELITEVYRRS